jgi:hypothetical protein
MKRRESARNRVKDALTNDRNHDAPCPAQRLTRRRRADVLKGAALGT